METGVTSDAAYTVARDRLGDRRWRLDNLYWIRDAYGRRVKFRMNWAQAALFDEIAVPAVELSRRISPLVPAFMEEMVMEPLDVLEPKPESTEIAPPESPLPAPPPISTAPPLALAPFFGIATQTLGPRFYRTASSPAAPIHTNRPNRRLTASDRVSAINLAPVLHFSSKVLHYIVYIHTRIY